MYVGKEGRSAGYLERAQVGSRNRLLKWSSAIKGKKEREQAACKERALNLVYKAIRIITDTKKKSAHNRVEFAMLPPHSTMIINQVS